MNNRRGDFNFVTIFAIFAGIAILILSIYGVTKGGDTQKYQSDSTIAKQISIFTDPMQAGFATSSSGKIDFHQTIKFRNRCESFSDFGTNRISVATQDTSGKTYGDFGAEITVQDKYLISNEELETQSLYTLSKTFSFPYDVADFIVLIPDSEQYCFENAPEFIITSLGALKIPMIHTENCSDKEMIQICTSNNDCDISIEGMCSDYECKSKYDYGIIEKDNRIIPFVGELVYPAIFVERDVYFCNVDRMLYRASLLSQLYTQKTDLLSSRLCATSTKAQLIDWTNSLESIENADQILGIYDKSFELKKINERSGCKTWD